MALLFDNGCTYLWGENIKLLSFDIHSHTTKRAYVTLFAFCAEIHIIPNILRKDYFFENSKEKLHVKHKKTVLKDYETVDH
jgi:hypothetical protein